GFFDEIYGQGYNEENDLIMRCNRRGYRAVLANHAFVYHFGGVSFSQTERPIREREAANRAILSNRFPEYAGALRRFFQGLDYKAQYLLAGLVKESSGRERLLFDCSHIGPFYDATFELAIHILREFAARHSYSYDCSVCCSHRAFLFHGMQHIEG